MHNGKYLECKFWKFTVQMYLVGNKTSEIQGRTTGADYDIRKNNYFGLQNFQLHVSVRLS